MQQPISDQLENSNQRRYHKVNLEKKELLIKFVLNDGKIIKVAAAELGIREENAKKIISRYKREQATESDAVVREPHARGKPKKITAELLEKIELVHEENSSYTLRRIKELLYVRHNIHISIGSISAALSRLKITLKKASMLKEMVNAPSTIEKRKLYALNFTNNAPEESHKCIFIDESGFNLHLRRSQARSRIGSRAVISVPTVRGRIQSLIIATSGTKIIYSKLITDGTCNGVKFTSFIASLLDILNADPIYHGSWIVMDNARIHYVNNVRELLSASDYILQFLSPYSYMLNPAEHVFSKIKLYVRARLSELHLQKESIVMEELISDAIQTITVSDCNNYFCSMSRNIALAIQERIFE